MSAAALDSLERRRWGLREAMNEAMPAARRESRESEPLTTNVRHVWESDCLCTPRQSWK